MIHHSRREHRRAGGDGEGLAVADEAPARLAEQHNLGDVVKMQEATNRRRAGGDDDALDSRHDTQRQLDGFADRTQQYRARIQQLFTLAAKAGWQTRDPPRTRLHR